MVRDASLTVPRIIGSAYGRWEPFGRLRTTMCDGIVQLEEGMGDGVLMVGCVGGWVGWERKRRGELRRWGAFYTTEIIQLRQTNATNATNVVRPHHPTDRHGVLADQLH